MEDVVAVAELRGREREWVVVVVCGRWGGERVVVVVVVVRWAVLGLG